MFPRNKEADFSNLLHLSQLFVWSKMLMLIWTMKLYYFYLNFFSNKWLFLLLLNRLHEKKFLYIKLYKEKYSSINLWNNFIRIEFLIILIYLQINRTFVKDDFHKKWSKINKSPIFVKVCEGQFRLFLLR